MRIVGLIIMNDKQISVLITSARPFQRSEITS